MGYNNFTLCVGGAMPFIKDLYVIRINAKDYFKIKINPHYADRLASL